MECKISIPIYIFYSEQRTLLTYACNSACMYVSVCASTAGCQRRNNFCQLIKNFK